MKFSTPLLRNTGAIALALSALVIPACSYGPEEAEGPVEGTYEEGIEGPIEGEGIGEEGFGEEGIGEEGLGEEGLGEEEGIGEVD